MIDWNEEQLELRAGMAPWFEALSEGHIELDRDHSFSDKKWDMVRRSGLLGLPFEERWGGLGQDLLTTMYLLEGLGEGCRDGGLNFSIATHITSTGTPVQRFGSDDLKARYMERVVSGELIGAHAISEPDSGSDAMAMRSTAKLSDDGDHYILNGSKTFVSNGPIADVFVIYAMTQPRLGAMGLSAFVVDADTPGFSRGQPLDKMGLKTSPMCQLFFDDCRIPAGNLIGKPGMGYSIMDYVMKVEILYSFIISVGEMQRRLDDTMSYARTRHQFKQPISRFQAVSHRLVDMLIKTRTARNWLYETAYRMARGQNVTIDIAISKLLASEGNVDSALHAIQIHGGNGYITEYGVEKDLRNAVGGTIYSGTSEIQRDRISKMLGL